MHTPGTLYILSFFSETPFWALRGQNSLLLWDSPFSRVCLMCAKHPRLIRDNFYTPEVKFPWIFWSGDLSWPLRTSAHLVPFRGGELKQDFHIYNHVNCKKNKKRKIFKIQLFFCSLLIWPRCRGIPQCMQSFPCGMTVACKAKSTHCSMVEFSILP